MTQVEVFLLQTNNINTKRSYSLTLSLFTEYCANYLEGDYKTIRVAIRDFLFEQGYLTSTAKNRLAGISAFFRFLQAEGMRADNPATALKLPNERYDRDSMPEFPKIDLVDEIIEYAKSDSTKLGKRNLAIAYCLRSGGFRVSELINLKPTDIDRSGKVRIRQAKGGKWRITAISKECLAIVDDWILEGSLQNDNFLFNLSTRHISRILTELAIGANLTPEQVKTFGHPHSWRHCWTTLHVRANTNSSLLQAQGGWCSDRMIQNYLVKDGIEPIAI